MAITPINPVQRPQKRDAMDRILQGLQIANEVFKIPVAYQELKAKSAMATNAELQSQATPEGYVPVAASESEVIGSGPKVAPLMPGQFGPEAPNVDYGPRQTLMPRMVDGEKKLIPFVAKDDLKSQDAKISKLRDDYTKEFEDVRTATLNYSQVDSNYKDALGKNRSAQQALLINTARLLNPGINRGADPAAVMQADTIPDQLRKAYNKLTGSSSASLDSNEVREVKGTADKAMRDRLDQAYQINSKYEDFAKGDRIDPKRIGIVDVSSFEAMTPKRGEMGSKPSGGEKSQKIAKGGINPAGAKAELARRAEAKKGTKIVGN